MKHSINRIMLLLSLLLLPLLASAQTTHGDFDYDGRTSINDLTFLINYLLTDQWNDEPTDVLRDTVVVNGVPFVMVHVDGGSFQRDGGSIITVEDFWIGKTEVTQELWEAVMNGSPNAGNKTPRHPQHDVSWRDCQSFFVRLNELTGRNFRIPYPDEWEFAARGGNRSCGYRYAGGNNPQLVAWYKIPNHAGSYAREVAQLKPNELGLYDMSGNVNEWCMLCILRSGNYNWDESHCLVTWSSVGLADGDPPYGTGFRIAM
ncbi:MAG: SUMF1/EgtB/PvdO family nonheme iron enzyme [Muribaculaceae bacterium]|nr:SUMF1/EgtB/PvdO family nonheme iron enzyme [Muribaculaceae bacterium]